MNNQWTTSSWIKKACLDVMQGHLLCSDAFQPIPGLISCDGTTAMYHRGKLTITDVILLCTCTVVCVCYWQLYSGGTLLTLARTQLSVFQLVVLFNCLVVTRELPLKYLLHTHGDQAERCTVYCIPNIQYVHGKLLRWQLWTEAWQKDTFIPPRQKSLHPRSYHHFIVNCLCLWNHLLKRTVNISTEHG